MEMKKIAVAVLFAAVSVSSVMAHEGHDHHDSPAPAPGPISGAGGSLPALASLVGASVVSFVAYYLN
ncbi:arabinogalactan peptide 23-like [Quillaja saponaria]|uniref:Arabinogalactan peptide 23-like n=1 Tax=Quillaja saponaria TaxID=32244 RepID=A0AAD7VNI8_QUISA|nr:arabinogalactan peptide 23-like [Quillaja saponaria]